MSVDFRNGRTVTKCIIFLNSTDMKPHKTWDISRGSENFNFSKNPSLYFKSRRDLLMQVRKCYLNEMRGDILCPLCPRCMNGVFDCFHIALFWKVVPDSFFIPIFPNIFNLLFFASFYFMNTPRSPTS